MAVSTLWCPNIFHKKRKRPDRPWGQSPVFLCVCGGLLFADELFHTDIVGSGHQF